MSESPRQERASSDVVNSAGSTSGEGQRTPAEQWDRRFGVRGAPLDALMRVVADKKRKET